jgi:DNA-binding transcriptional LysR family regulator
VELRHLRYFVAVAEELNFSRAARRLHMAQPPLSVAIRQLEQEIGADLFTRTSREVKLTEAGKALLAGARRTLAEADAAATAAKRVAAGELGILRLGYNWSAGFETLPTLGQAFRRRRPDVELVAEEMRPKLMTAALRSQTIDVGLALYAEIVEDFSYQPIRSEPVVAVLSSSHPLAGEETIRLDALAAESLLFPRDVAPRLHDFYIDLCRSAGFEPKHSNESARTRWMLGTWDTSTAALVPQSVSGRLPTGAVAVPISAPKEPLETQLVWRSENQSAALAAFVVVASGVFAAVGQPSSGRQPAAAPDRGREKRRDTRSV